MRVLLSSADYDNKTLITARIIVVSDNLSAQHKVHSHLSAMGARNFTMVNSARKSLQILRQQSADLLLVDVDTHDLDGWRLARLVRSGILACPADIPIMMLASTWCERIAEVTAREYGINHFLPIDHISQMPAILTTLLNEKQAVAPKPRLLVIEDQADTSDLILRILGTTFDIEIASDGQQGLQAWLHKRHDIVLLDVMLPKLSGPEVLHEILQRYAEQPIVIMTAHASIDQAEDLMLQGAVDFLSKPFRPEQLRRVCNIALLREDYLVSNAQFAERVTALKERESAYKNLYESHHQLLDDLQSVVMELDQELNIIFLNRTWETLTGFSIAESIGQNIEHFVRQDHLGQFAQIKTQLLAALGNKNNHCEVELCLRDAQNQTIWTQLKVSCSNATTNAATLTVCVDNVTERKRTQAQLEHLAMHDSLTGLYNRHYFEIALEQLGTDAQRSKRRHGLVYIDLDYFKVINDTFGHQRGDDVLRELSSLVLQCIRGADLFCRLGGDEFAVLLHDACTSKIKEFAYSVQRIISECSFDIQGQRIHLSSSIGLALIDGSAALAEEYLMKADIALYVAKGRGRNLVHLYDPADRESEDMRHSINWTQKVREAIEEDRMLLYFQPVFDVNKNEVAYYEALVRMRERNGNVIGPGDFIPALENKGEMQMLDRRVIELGTQTLKRYPDLKHIAINLSAQAFKDENLVAIITQCLEDSGVDARSLTFELTESASLFNLSITQRVIRDLHTLGCTFSVDDFGSGFSSFSYLKQLPADYIKLDGSFIQNLDKDPVDQKLVKSIVQVIQALGKKAVAEYVENEQILLLLKEMSIDFVQGYHIGYPRPVAELFPDKN